jgi:hypothetical protein
VPGVVGPERVIEDRFAVPAPEGGIGFRLEIEFDHERWRYVCRELCARGHVNTQALRLAAMRDFIGQSLGVSLLLIKPGVATSDPGLTQP